MKYLAISAAALILLAAPGAALAQSDRSRPIAIMAKWC